VTLLREKYTNGVATTLAEVLDASETGIDVTDASSWPTSGFRVRVEDEIMYCTSRASNTLTVVRGAEGTTAATHATGLAINHVITAQALDRIRLGILADCGIAPYVESASADDDEFDDDSFSGWTAVNTTPALVSTTEKNHRLSVIMPTGTASAQYYAWMKTKTPGANDWIQAGFQIAGSGTQYPIPGLIMANGTTYGSGKQIVLGFSAHENLIILRDMTGYNTHVGVLGSSFGNISNYLGGYFHLRLAWISNDHYSAWISGDGNSWATIFTNQALGSLGAAPTKLGFGFTTWAASREFQMSSTYCRFSF
jgi:hypothetical protein